MENNENCFEFIHLYGGNHKGVIVELSGEQLVRIETDIETDRTYVYVWNGVDEDYTTKVEVFIGSK